MTETGFDDLTRDLAAGKLSRRQRLRTLIALAGGMFFNPYFRFSGKNRPLVLGVARASAQTIPTCQSTNNISIPCEELNAYVAQCGVICPDGNALPGSGGCTIPNISNQITRFDDISFSKVGKQWCASTTITWVWLADPQTSILSWSPSEPPCCAQSCNNEIANVLGQLQAHENEHVAIINNVIANVNSIWSNRVFQDCAKTKKDAEAQLEINITSQKAQTETFVNQQIAEEPDQPPPINCGLCTPAATQGMICCVPPPPVGGDGICVNPACTNGQVFNPTTCLCECPTGLTPCGTQCCQPNQVCQNGQCIDLCPPGGFVCLGPPPYCCFPPPGYPPYCFYFPDGSPGCCALHYSDPATVCSNPAIPKACCKQ
jgi:hypothetical protein